MINREERIRERAHKIWEEEGRPENQHERHWQMAQREIDAEEIQDRPEVASSVPMTKPSEANAPGDKQPSQSGANRAIEGASTTGSGFAQATKRPSRRRSAGSGTNRGAS